MDPTGSRLDSFQIHQKYSKTRIQIRKRESPYFMDSFQYIKFNLRPNGRKVSNSQNQLSPTPMIYVWMHQWNRFSVKKDIFFLYFISSHYIILIFFYLNFLLHSFAALRCSSVHVLPLQQLSICESCKL